MAEIVINDDTPRDQYVATAGQTIFPYTFPIFDQGDVVVLQTSGGVTTTLTITTEYTVSGVGAEAGGDITLVTGATVGDILTIYRDVPIARTTDFVTGGDYRAETINRELDLQTMMMQQNELNASRSIHLKPEDTTTTMDLPLTADRANKALIFDASGNATVSTDDYEDQVATVAASAAAAATSASNAATSESNAATSASNAATSASNASTSETNAATSETNAAASAAAAAVSETNALDAFDWQGAYSAVTAYNLNDAVEYNGSIYMCIQAGTGQQPDISPLYWELGASKGDTGATGATGATGPAGPEGLIWQGAYSGATAYVVDDAVAHNGSSYICILATTGNAPPNATYWNLLASKGDAGAGSGDMLAATYDPTTVAGDAFDMDNMAEGTANKILTATERTNIANSVTHAADTANPHGVTAAQAGAEPAFAKNTGFNKNFGTGAGTVAEGNHLHTGVYEPADATILKDADIGVNVEAYNANIQSHIASTANPHGVTAAQAGAKVSGAVEGIATGGSGQTTQQAAIDAISNVSAATNEHVLTKDTATGNAVFKAAAGGADTSLSNLTATGKDKIATAWVSVNQLTTQTILDSFNVASITDGGNGITTVTYTTAMANANYAIVTGSRHQGSNTGVNDNTYYTAPTTAQCQVAHVENNATVDTGLLSIVIFGGT